MYGIRYEHSFQEYPINWSKCEHFVAHSDVKDKIYPNLSLFYMVNYFFNVALHYIEIVLYCVVIVFIVLYRIVSYRIVLYCTCIAL